MKNLKARRYWRLYTVIHNQYKGQNRCIADICHKGGFIVAGWGDMGCLPQPSNGNEKQIEEKLGRHCGKIDRDAGSRELNRCIKVLCDFSVKMKKGDIILLSGAVRSPYFWVGKVDGGYYFKKDRSLSDYWHRRPVEWLKKLSKEELGGDAGLWHELVGYPEPILRDVTEYKHELNRLLLGI